MMKLFSIVGLLFLFSCSDAKKCDCEDKGEKIEARLKELLSEDNQLAKVDVPKSSDQNMNEIVVVKITAQGKYILDEVSYTFEDLEPELNLAIAESGSRKVKIEGDKNARYEAVFKIIAYAQMNGLDPILAYKK